MAKKLLEQASRCTNPFAEEFETEEIVADKHAVAAHGQVDALAEGIRKFAAHLTAEECARVPQLHAAKQAMSN